MSEDVEMDLRERVQALELLVLGLLEQLDTVGRSEIGERLRHLKPSPLPGPPELRLRLEKNGRDYAQELLRLSRS